MMQETKQFDWLSVATIPLIILIALLTIRYNVGALLFHTTVELFSVFVGVLMFIVVLNTEHFLKSDFLTFLGIGYFFLSILDAMHTFTMTGLPYFKIADEEVTIHFWLFGRLFEALILISSAYFLKHSVSKSLISAFFLICTFLISWISFNVLNPPMLIDGNLSDFKIYTEYIIIAVLILAAFVFIKHKRFLSNRILRYLLSSIILTIGAEVCFTQYANINSPVFVIGHLFKFLSYWSIYQAIVLTSLKEPLLFLTQRSNSYDVIPIPSIWIDQKANIVQTNEAALMQFETKFSDVLHQPIHNVFHPNDVNEAQCSFCQIIKKGQKISSKEVFFSEINQWFLLSIAPIDKTKPFAGIVQTLTNITYQKKQEHELSIQQEVLEEKVKERTIELEESIELLEQTKEMLVQSEKMASLGNLVTGIAHEINAPIGICITAASSLIDNTKEIKNKFKKNKITKSIFDNFIDEVEGLSTILEGNLQRTTELVSSFKLVSMTEADEERRHFFIKEYVTEVLHSLSAKLRESKITVVFEENNDFEIYCLPNAIFQIFTNLINNSIIHGFAKGQEGIIEIDIIKENEVVKVCYKDSGDGVSQVSLNQIFEPFFTTNRINGSSGLGLHVVYNLVNQVLNGNITCHSKIGRGIRFDISFPCLT